MKPSDAIETNQAAWEEAASRFKDHSHAFWLEHFRRPGFCSLTGMRLQAIKQMDVRGKSVAQLCCNNARELLSVKNLGAGFCAGFDISESLVNQGRELAAAGGIDCDLVACDVHAVPASYNGRFDLVMTTAGSLRWMPNLSAFMAVVARLLKPGGQYLANEIHPLLDVFERNEDDKPLWARSYNESKQIVSHKGIAYEGVESNEALPHVWYHHQLGSIVTAAIGAGLELQGLQELGENISGAYDYLVPNGIRPPFSYLLLARKKAAPAPRAKSRSGADGIA